MVPVVMASTEGGVDIEEVAAKTPEKIVKEVKLRLEFLINVGLDYLSLERSADTLSGGEAQRIRLASQIGSGLTGVMYVLDEPTIGLHQRDNDRLIGTLKHLRDLGNSVLVAAPEIAERPEFAGYHVVPIIPGEEYAANCVRVNDRVLIATGFPYLLANLQWMGFDPIELDMWEFEKMDGGLSCLSLRF